MDKIRYILKEWSYMARERKEALQQYEELIAYVRKLEEDLEIEINNHITWRKYVELYRPDWMRSESELVEPKSGGSDGLERHLIWWVEEQKSWEETPESTTLQDEAQKLLDHYRAMRDQNREIKLALLRHASTIKGIMARSISRQGGREP